MNDFSCYENPLLNIAVLQASQQVTLEGIRIFALLIELTAEIDLQKNRHQHELYFPLAEITRRHNSIFSSKRLSKTEEEIGQILSKMENHGIIKNCEKNGWVVTNVLLPGGEEIRKQVCDARKRTRSVQVVRQTWRDAMGSKSKKALGAAAITFLTGTVGGGRPGKIVRNQIARILRCCTKTIYRIFNEIFSRTLQIVRRMRHTTIAWGKNVVTKVSTQRKPKVSTHKRQKNKSVHSIYHNPPKEPSNPRRGRTYRIVEQERPIIEIEQEVKVNKETLFLMMQANREVNAAAI